MKQILPLGTILVVAATERELAPSAGWRVLRCGVGPIEAAAATAVEIGRSRPRAVVNVGIAGARRSSGLTPGSLIVGSAAQYCDVPAADWVPHLLNADERLVEAARRALPGASARLIGTSGRVGGTVGCDVEAMEGFAVLRAAAVAGIPAVEVRSISNFLEEADRSLWRFEDAFAAITAATPTLVQEIERCLG